MTSSFSPLSCTLTSTSYWEAWGSMEATMAPCSSFPFYYSCISNCYTMSPSLQSLSSQFMY